MRRRIHAWQWRGLHPTPPSPLSPRGGRRREGEEEEAWEEEEEAWEEEEEASSSFSGSILASRTRDYLCVEGGHVGVFVSWKVCV